MEKRIAITSLIVCLLTWCAVILVFVQVNKDPIIGSSLQVTDATHLTEKAHLQIHEEEQRQVASESIEKQETIEDYASEQEFHDGVPIDELLEWLENNEEAVPSS